MLYNMTLTQPCLCCGQPVSISAKRPTQSSAASTAEDAVPEGRYTLLFTCTNPDCPVCMRPFDSAAYNEQEVARCCGKAADNG